MKVYADNGLPFYQEHDITTRNYLVESLATAVKNLLQTENRAWVFARIEAPSLIPTELVSQEYTSDDIYLMANDDLYLRPETTGSTYAYLAYRNEHQTFVPPFCAWQLAKSFRRENDQVSKNMRYKEFYQLEFQCLYGADTKNDYQEAVLEPLRAFVGKMTGWPTRVVPSDRLPSYSEKTMDIEVHTKDKWLEVCSISLRNDVPFEWNGKKLKNLEIAFGADRLVNVIWQQ